MYDLRKSKTISGIIGPLEESSELPCEPQYCDWNSCYFCILSSKSLTQADNLIVNKITFRTRFFINTHCFMHSFSFHAYKIMEIIENVPDILEEILYISIKYLFLFYRKPFHIMTNKDCFGGFPFTHIQQFQIHLLYFYQIFAPFLFYCKCQQCMILSLLSFCLMQLQNLSLVGIIASSFAINCLNLYYNTILK